MEKFKIALVTCSSMSNFETHLENEEELLLNFLKKKEIEAKIEVWDDTSVNWESYDVVMIKSTWDYFDKVEQFRVWLDEMEKRQIKIYNSIGVLRWNMDKIYLNDLEKADIKVISTIWLDKNASFSLQKFKDELGAEEMIVKPRISGASKNTFKVGTENLKEIELKLNELIKHEDFMAQPYMKEIELGEQSFLFFNGKFSHAVKKVPKANDFRVQHYFGGSIIPLAPDASIMKQAQKVCDLFAPDCLYARVDGIVKDGILYIIELEIIEPLLYLYTHPAAFDTLLDAIKTKLETQLLKN